MPFGSTKNLEGEWLAKPPRELMRERAANEPIVLITRGVELCLVDMMPALFLHLKIMRKPITSLGTTLYTSSLSTRVELLACFPLRLRYFTGILEQRK